MRAVRGYIGFSLKGCLCAEGKKPTGGGERLKIEEEMDLMLFIFVLF